MISLRIFPRCREIALAFFYLEGFSSIEEKSHRDALELKTKCPSHLSNTVIKNKIKKMGEAFQSHKFVKEIRFYQETQASWTQEYKKFLKPFPILSPKKDDNFEILYVDPRGKVPQKLKENTLYINATLAFGVGTHPSTELAAQALAQILSSLKAKRVLDMGCGTGILSMIAKRMGAIEVWAIDNDPQALRIARENFRNNRLPKIILKDSLKGNRKVFSVIVANILLLPLVELHDVLVKRLAKGGIIILSGLLYRDVTEILKTYKGLKLLFRKNKKGWTSLTFQKI